MPEVTYGNCDKCKKVNDVYAVYQYMKTNSLTTKGKKFACVCYSCSDQLIQNHNENSKTNPQLFIPIPFDPNDSKKNSKVVLANCIFENNIYELASDDGADEGEGPSEVKEVDPSNELNRYEVKMQLKLIKGGAEAPKKAPFTGKLPSFTAQEIFEKLSQKIIGQDEAIKSLSVATERYLESIKDPNVKKISLLITGTTAVGKTASVNALESIVGIPVLSYNMKHFTTSGYVGKEVSDIVSQACEITGNAEKPRAIILLDEIDKLGMSESSESFLKTDVFYELLTIIEGGRAVVAGKKNSGESSKNVDTSELFFVMAGSFHKIMDKKAEKTNRKHVGLTTNNSNVIELRPELMTVNITDADLLASGMPREFIGRIHTRVPFRTLSESEYVDVIKKSSDSPLKSYYEYFKKRNIFIEFDDSYLKHVAKIVSQNGLGVRGVIGVVEKDLNNVMFDSKHFTGAILRVESDGKIERVEVKTQMSH